MTTQVSLRALIAAAAVAELGQGAEIVKRELIDFPEAPRALGKYRSRRRNGINPSGSKLARKAREGKL